MNTECESPYFVCKIYFERYLKRNPHLSTGKWNINLKLLNEFYKEAYKLLSVLEISLNSLKLCLYFHLVKINHREIIYTRMHSIFHFIMI